MNLGPRLQWLERHHSARVDTGGRFGEYSPYFRELEMIDRRLTDDGVCLEPVVEDAARLLASGMSESELAAELAPLSRFEIPALRLRFYSLFGVVLHFAKGEARRLRPNPAPVTRERLLGMANTPAYEEANDRYAKYLIAEQESQRHLNDGIPPAYLAMSDYVGCPCCNRHGGGWPIPWTPLTVGHMNSTP
jgi:hypothetical protein